MKKKNNILYLINKNNNICGITNLTKRLNGVCGISETPPKIYGETLKKSR